MRLRGTTTNIWRRTRVVDVGNVVLCCNCATSAMFLRRFAPPLVQYVDGEEVILWVNKVGPFRNPQETYKCKAGVRR
jgi:hypothetical protein